MESSEENSKEDSSFTSPTESSSTNFPSPCEWQSSKEPSSQEHSFDSKIIHRFLKGREELFLNNLKGIIFVKDIEKKNINSKNNGNTPNYDGRIPSLSVRDIPVLIATVGASKQQAASKRFFHFFTIVVITIFIIIFVIINIIIVITVIMIIYYYCYFFYYYHHCYHYYYHYNCYYYCYYYYYYYYHQCSQLTFLYAYDR
jgi:hypothetical protein